MYMDNNWVYVDAQFLMNREYKRQKKDPDTFSITGKSIIFM